jgi:hypothetical protein
MTTVMVRDFGKKQVEREYDDLTISMKNFLLRLIPSGLSYRTFLKAASSKHRALLARCLLGVLPEHADGGSCFPRNVGKLLLNY